MSVTFWVPDAPRHDETCEWCTRARTKRDGDCALDKQWVKDPSRLSDEDWARVTCDPWCGGTHEVSAAPEVNFANANARAVLALLNLNPADLCGSLQTDEISPVLQRLLVVMNRGQARAHLVREGSDRRAFEAPRMMVDPDTGMDTISRGCRVIDGGNTDEQTMRRLGTVRDLLSHAQEHGFSVSWG